MKTSLLLASALALVSAAPAHAAALRTLADLNSITIYEETFGRTPLTYVPGSSVLTNRIADPLDATHFDFSFFGGEYYDAFYSDANGAFNLDGSYLTIEGVWRPGAHSIFGGMNINGASLDFGGTTPIHFFADQVASFQMGSYCNVNLGDNCIIGSEALAVDGNLNSFPRFGETDQTDLADRFRLTLGFSPYSQAANAVPEPATWAMMLVGFGAMGAALRRRQKVAVSFA